MSYIVKADEGEQLQGQITVTKNAQESIMIDLHEYTLETLDWLLKEDDALKSIKEIQIITGKGLHSDDGIAVLKERLLAYCEKKSLRYDIPESNN